jgi:hypothetical protein
MTFVPVHPDEDLGHDTNDDENNPECGFLELMRRIDRLEVSDGDRAFMKMWNTHISKRV